MSQLLVYGIRFKKATRVVDFDGTGVELAHGDLVIVEVEKGLGMGTVVNGPREPITQGRKVRKVIRKADTTDVERFGFNSEREDEAFRVCREKIAKYRLPMKLVSVEYLFDSSKVIFYFTSDTRVDFRGLVKDLASAFHTRIEMRQIGVRDEAKMIGGLGPCGRVLCCASFLSTFEPVTIKMAKDQNLALNPVKISGVCGRLMCCLSFEHEAYKKNKGKVGGSGGHGCHKGGQKGSGQRDSGQKHCGAHASGKPSGDRQPGDRQPDRQQSRGSQEAGRPEGSRPESESGDRPSRNRSGRNRPNRNRPNRNRPNQAKEAGSSPEARAEAQSQSTVRTEGGAQSPDRQQGNRSESEGDDRPNRNRQSRERSGRNRSGRNRSGRNRSNPNRPGSDRQAGGKASSGQGSQGSQNGQSGDGNKGGDGGQSGNSTPDTNPNTNKDS
jgi:cell fate regulator YaaT (PSP1 superfamily)